MMVPLLPYLVILVCFLAMLPTILNFKIHPLILNDISNRNISNVPKISPALSSAHVQISYIIGASISSVLIFDKGLFAAIYMINLTHEFKMLWVLFASFFLPTIISLALIDESNVYFGTIRAILTCRQILVCVSSFSLMSTCNPQIWKWYMTVTFMVSLSVFVLLSLVVPYLPHSQWSVMRVILWLVLAVVIAFYLCLITKWYICIARSNSNLILSAKDLNHTMYLISFSFFLFGPVIGVECNVLKVWTDLNSVDLMMSMYMFSANMVLMIMFIGHHTFREYLSDKVNELAHIKQLVIGYFSHELRTPLNSALMGLHIIKSELANIEEVGKRCIDTVKDVESSCSMVADILNDLLMYESVDLRENDLQMHTLELRPLLEMKFDIFREQAEDRHVELSTVFTRRCTGSTQVLADEVKIRQVIRHLLSNALESAGEGGKVDVKVDVARLRGQMAGQATLSLQVTDSGPSISEIAREKLFCGDAFEVTAGVMEAMKVGALGLLISHRIMIEHNGTISYTPGDNGRGNVFTITLPVHQMHSESFLPLSDILEEKSEELASLEAEERQVSSKSGDQQLNINRTASTELADVDRLDGDLQAIGAANFRFKSDSECVPSTDKRKMGSVRLSALFKTQTFSPDNPPMVVDMNDQTLLKTVLVVDDVTMNRKMLCRLMEGLCEKTITAENGQLAVNLVRQSVSEHVPFDLVLMDYQMPVMDGPTAAKAMRELGYKGPIIGVTGNVLSVHKDNFISHGANIVLTKPLSFEALTQAVEDFASHHQLSTPRRKLSSSVVPMG